jgi:hypothetical protein
MTDQIIDAYKVVIERDNKFYSAWVGRHDTSSFLETRYMRRRWTLPPLNSKLFVFSAKRYAIHFIWQNFRRFKPSPARLFRCRARNPQPCHSVLKLRAINTRAVKLFFGDRKTFNREYFNVRATYESPGGSMICDAVKLEEEIYL